VAHAARLGVDDLDDFTGFVSEQAKHEELSRAWVLAMPSLKEGWGLCVMEAATHGVPSVAYRAASGVAESIVDHQTGLLVDGGVAEFTEALRRLIADQALRTSLGDKARARAGTFHWEDTARAFVAVLSKVTGIPDMGDAGVAAVPLYHREGPGSPGRG
jgi:glycosyltransferase involved in cell wall biosynthesis